MATPDPGLFQEAVIAREKAAHDETMAIVEELKVVGHYSLAVRVLELTILYQNITQLYQDMLIGWLNAREG